VGHAWRFWLPLLRGRYAERRLEVPTLLVFGSDDFVLRPQMLAGYQRHAEETRVELVEACGHFIADEMPDLVTQHAREFLPPGVL
jgi:pimeloyl-ACP methyl ester carboxylesterase